MNKYLEHLMNNRYILPDGPQGISHVKQDLILEYIRARNGIKYSDPEFSEKMRTTLSRIVNTQLRRTVGRVNLRRVP